MASPYEKNNDEDEDTTQQPNQCYICLRALTNTSFLNGCLHRFCGECIKRWAKRTNQCPVCRSVFTCVITSLNGKSGSGYTKVHVHPGNLASRLRRRLSRLYGALTGEAKAPQRNRRHALRPDDYESYQSIHAIRVRHSSSASRNTLGDDGESLMLPKNCFPSPKAGFTPLQAFTASEDEELILSSKSLTILAKKSEDKQDEEANNDRSEADKS